MSSHPTHAHLPARRTLRQRVKAWPLAGKIAAIGCAIPVGFFTLLVVLGIIIAIAAPELAESDEAAAETVTETPIPTPVSAAPESVTPSAEPTDTASATPTPRSSATASETPTPSPARSPSPTENPREASAVVTRVVDGDTVEIEGGQRVRLLGIDTPEQGECHFETASARMAELVQGQTVTLTRDGEDTDRYDRLLRYLDVGNTDAGLTLIQEGLAISRYDSRDGYGFHTREPQYVAADSATAMQSCAPPPAPAPAPAPAPEQNASDCDPNYTPCVPVYPPDINCSDISFPVRVIGSDVHGLDADNDGVGCESN
ncbi:thermonuclease family protein [Nesterenkonia haasae]|uniref:thermonuclease family protein n=1 Tax=Nesterenkonia haasae TaxID=2587813 RepID=UPI001391F30D|nr:thermonuclease family protein [Nesterenkonia haasae]NDK31143.1 nuclease [Nesterenkonia haasae]